MKNSKIRNAIAEHGYEMTNDEIEQSKRSIVKKFITVMPEIRGMSIEDALDYITDKIGPEL